MAAAKGGAAASSVASQATTTLSHGVQALYRSLLRVGKVYDRNPSAKALIAAPELLPSIPAPLKEAMDDLLVGPLGSPPADGTAVRADSLIRDVVRQYRSTYLGGKPFYLPGSTPKTMVDTIKTAFRDKDFHETHGRLLCVDAGTEVLRELTDAANLLYTMHDYEENRLPGLSGLEGELEAVKNVRAGTLLLEHPAITYPGRSAILVYDLAQNVKEVHGNEDWVMRGVAINRPLRTTVGSMFPGWREGLGVLSDAPVFVGGLKYRRMLTMLHRFESIQGSVPVGEHGLFVGGSAHDANALIAGGKATVDDFKLFLGCSEWIVDMEKQTTVPGIDGFIYARGTLVEPLSLLPAMFGVQNSEDGSDDGSASAAKDGAGVDDGDEENEEYDHLHFFHQNVLWAQAMRSLGGEYADMAGLHPAVVEVIEEETFGVATGPFEDIGDERDDVVPETSTIQPDA